MTVKHGRCSLKQPAFEIIRIFMKKGQNTLSQMRNASKDTAETVRKDTGLVLSAGCSFRVEIECLAKLFPLSVPIFLHLS